MIQRTFLVCFLFVAFSIKGDVNVKFPTVGGKLFWSDIKIVNGWRVQENLVTGHYRLLNPRLIRYTWGSKDHCLAEMSTHTIVDSQKKTVLLIHGYGLRKHSLKCLQPLFEKQGYQVINFGYSTIFESIEESAIKLKSVLNDYEGDISVVTHSMGGILFRYYQQEYERDFNKLVMIAPPNNGVEVIDFLKDAGLSGLTGVNGKRLHTGAQSLPNTLPPPRTPFIVIAGTKTHKCGFAPLFNFIPGNHDGLVSEESTRMDEAEAHYSVPINHYTIMYNKDVQEIVTNYLLN